jgi:hypothetical protein
MRGEDRAGFLKKRQSRSATGTIPMKIHIPGAGAVELSGAAKLSGVRGRKTGIDVISRAVVTKGRGHGIATPCNAMMAGLIAFRESLAGGERP